MQVSEKQTVHTAPTRQTARHPGWRHTLIEIVMVLIVTGAYFLTRGLIRGRQIDAFANAQRVLDLETQLHLNIESAVQHFALMHPWMIAAANNYYLFGHLPVLIGVAVWLYIARPWMYPRFRNAFLLSALIGLAIYVLFPTAPPRFLPGFKDTMAASGFNVDGSAAGPFYNPYAAMPSLHVGWSFLSGTALIMTTRRWWSRLIGVALPVLMFVAVIITGNHFVLDTIAGVLVTTLAFTLTAAWSRPVTRPLRTTSRQIFAWFLQMWR